MPVRIWKAKSLWCAKWGTSGKTYCKKSKKAAKALAEKQAQAIYASGYKKKGS